MPGRAAKTRRDVLRGWSLFLPGAAQQIFLPFIEREFPHLAARYARPTKKASTSAAATRTSGGKSPPHPRPPRLTSG